MEYSFGILAFWILLLMPLGLALHWIALGASARVQAAPMAPLTGIAAMVVVLAALRQAGVRAGEPAIAIVFIVVAVIATLVQWRRGTAWRSRQIAGAATLLVIAVMLLSGPAFNRLGEGPLGVGTGHLPVMQVATIHGAAEGVTGAPPIVREAVRSQDERFTGFEQFAAFTVAAGSRTTAQAVAKSTTDGTTASGWTAYSLQPLIGALLLAMSILPLFVAARWQGVRVVGLVTLLLLGTTSAVAMVTMAVGNAVQIAGAAIITAMLAALVLGRRDRGWFAIAALFAAAGVAVVGPLALLPALLLGATWYTIARRSHEHLAHTDTPVDVIRPAVVGVVAVMLGLFGTAEAILAGAGVPGPFPFSTVPAALTSWPAAWLSPTLDVTGAIGTQSALVFVLGIAALVVVAWHALTTRDRREIAVLIGLIGSVLVCLAYAVIDTEASAHAIAATWVFCTPLLTLAIVRAVGAARADTRDDRVRRAAAGVPLLIISLFGLVSMAAATTTAIRATHAPDLRGSRIVAEGRILFAAGDPWLTYFTRGERVRGNRIDADQLVKPRNRYSGSSIVFERPAALVLSNDPTSSDPPSGYQLTDKLPQYPVRVFGDERTAKGVAATPLPLRHDPVETAETRATGVPGGMLLPDRTIATCSLELSGPCEAPKPITVGTCTTAEQRTAESPPSAAALREDARRRTAAAERPTSQNGATAQSTPPFRDGLLDPPLLGVACFSVPLATNAKTLVIHVKDVGLIIPPSQATLEPDEVRPLRRTRTARLHGGVTGGEHIVTDTPDAETTWGNEHLASSYDLTLEGDLGAGVVLSTQAGSAVGTAQELQTTWDGFATTVRNAPVYGSIAVRNSSGTALELGRMFARPLGDLATACNPTLPIVAGATRRFEQVAETAEGEEIRRPAITATITQITGSGGARTARVVVGSYLQEAGAPRHQLVDWTEQLAAVTPQPACQGLDVQPSAETRPTRTNVARALPS